VDPVWTPPPTMQIKKLKSIWQMQKLDMEIFYLKKCIVAEGNKKLQDKISKMFAVLENLDDDMNISRAWKTIRENIQISDKESRLL
jgi:hypothetical protein